MKRYPNIVVLPDFLNSIVYSLHQRENVNIEPNCYTKSRKEQKIYQSIANYNSLTHCNLINGIPNKYDATAGNGYFLLAAA